MAKKRIIYALLFKENSFFLSRNFKLQKVGGTDWLKKNYGFGETCDFIDELIVLNVKPNPTNQDIQDFVKAVNELREKLFVPITLGGGIRDIETAKLMFENGADKICCCTLLEEKKNIINEISEIYGSQALSIMVDYKIINDKPTSYINCGTKISNEVNSDFIDKLNKLNCGEIIFNSIDLDGTGYGLDTKTIDAFTGINKPILLMGGAGKPEHFQILENNKISGVITANLFNFLGSGLKLSRDHCLKNSVDLVNFQKIDL